MSRHINPFGLRLPIKTKKALENAANKNGRSLNAELVSRLEESLEIDDFLNHATGYGTIRLEFEEALNKLEQVSEAAEREYGIEMFDAMKDEILEAIREQKSSK